MSFLSGLNSFAGGMAQGIQAGQKMKLDREEADLRRRADKRQQDDADRKAIDWNDQQAIEAEAAKAYSQPRTSLPQLEGPGYDSQEMAARLATTPMTPSDTLSSTVAGLPTMAGAPPQKAPTPAASGQGAIPTGSAPTPPPQAPQLTQVQDPMTGRWHNVDSSAVRPATDTERAQAVAQVYFQHGKAADGIKLLHEYFTGKAAEIATNREDTYDALMRGVANPEAFAAAMNDRVLKPNNMNYTVEAVRVPGPDGTSFPALRINREGSSLPPQYLDAQGQPTSKPDPAAWRTLPSVILSEVKGDGGVGMLTSLASIDSMMTNKAIALSREVRERQAFPLEQAQRRASLTQTRVGTAATVQGMGIARNQDARAQGEYIDTVSPEARGAVTITANNNPGALKWSPWQAAFGGRPDPNSEFTVFPNAKAGIAAQEQLLTKNYAGKTINQIVDTYAPATENTPEERANYKRRLSSQLGIPVTGVVPPDRVSELAAAMRGVETGVRSGGIPPREARTAAREDVKNSRERLEKIRDTAITLVSQQMDPTDPSFEGSVRGTMLRLLGNEPAGVQQAFKQQYAGGYVPFKRQGR